MNPYKKLIGNSAIFAIGTLGSKIITFLLLPLYTFYLSTEQYGVTDLVLTTVNLLIPITFLSVQTAVLRFVMDTEKNNKKVMSNTLIIAILSYLFTLMFYPLLTKFNILGENLRYMYILLLLIFCERYLSQYARATGKLKVFAVNGILLSFVLGISNIIFLVLLKLGLNGFFYAYIISYIITIIYLILSTKVYKEVSYKFINFKESIDILHYSVPMIPNSVMWWLVSTSSRYFIRIFVGLSANGVFGIASKIPAILSMVNEVFMQAWQISAIEKYKDKNKATFYSNVFSYMSSISLVLTSLFVLSIKIIFATAFEQDYYIGWRVTPFLLLGTVFSNLSGFLGTNYIVEKQTTGVFKTSVYGGIISIIMNILLIPTLGIEGAGISSFVSFLIMFLIRYYDTRKYISVKIKWNELITSTLIIIFQILILYISFPIQIELILNIFLFLILLVVNKSLMKPVRLLIERFWIKFIK